MTGNDSGAGPHQPDAATTTRPSAPQQITERSAAHRSDVDEDPLRRRRAAAWQCPPLDCGRRDPLDPLPAHLEQAADERVESWAAAVAHLRRLGYDVRFAVPADVAKRLSVAA